MLTLLINKGVSMRTPILKEGPYEKEYIFIHFIDRHTYVHICVRSEKNK
jgi:hypothetical protein